MIDPVTLAVVRGSLEQIADEMDLHLIHAAISPIISETNDCAHGIFHPPIGRQSDAIINYVDLQLPAGLTDRNGDHSPRHPSLNSMADRIFDQRLEQHRWHDR